MDQEEIQIKGWRGECEGGIAKKYIVTKWLMLFKREV
jgi:hypothetical protein